MTKKKLPAVRLVDRNQAPELPELSEELRLAYGELAEWAYGCSSR